MSKNYEVILYKNTLCLGGPCNTISHITVAKQFIRALDSNLISYATRKTVLDSNIQWETLHPVFVVKNNCTDRLHAFLEIHIFIIFEKMVALLLFLIIHRIRSLRWNRLRPCWTFKIPTLKGWGNGGPMGPIPLNFMVKSFFNFQKTCHAITWQVFRKFRATDFYSSLLIRNGL